MSSRPGNAKGYTVIVWVAVISIVTAAVFFITVPFKRTLQAKAMDMADFAFWCAPAWNNGTPWPGGVPAPQYKGEINTYTDERLTSDASEDIHERNLHDITSSTTSQNTDNVDSWNVEEGSEALLHRLRPPTR